MTWTDFQRTIFFRLEVRLARQEKVFTLVDDYLGRYFTTDDPVRREVVSTLKQIKIMREVVADALDRLPKPWRPGVDPYKTSGLAARLKPDFAARGITERQMPDEPQPGA